MWGGFQRLTGGLAYLSSSKPRRDSVSKKQVGGSLRNGSYTYGHTCVHTHTGRGVGGSDPMSLLKAT